MGLFICVFIVTSFVTQSFQSENMAFGKPVTVSKRYNDINFDPSLAVDGDVSTDLLKCSLTASGEREAWLTVDLGEVKNIASISFIHGGFGLNAEPMDPGYTGIYPVLSGNGSLQHSWNSDKNYTVCTTVFRYESAKVVCLNWGYLPDNPAPYRVPLQSNLFFSRFYYKCIGNETVLNECTIGSFRNGCSNQGREQIGISCESGDTLAGFSVYVSDTPDRKSGSLCYQHDINEPVENSISIDCFTTGRYVTIYNSRNGSLRSTLYSFAYINICEVNVTGCNVGHYGDDCVECPSHCINNTCQMQVGHCFDCKDGYTGPMCEKVCPAGQYGKQCSFQCGSCLDQEPCHHINGSCIFGCSPGWKGENCDRNCDPGYFGFECNSTCNITKCVNSTSCEPISGHCTSGCLSNFSGPSCQDCAPTYYGDQCKISCSVSCENQLCNQTTGYCFSCTATRSGAFCENEITLDKSAAIFDSNAGFIVTSAFLAVFMIVTLVYVVKRKWFSSSTQTLEQNYELPVSPKLTFEYQEIQSKSTGGEIDINVSEYSEIAMVETNMSRTEYSNVL